MARTATDRTSADSRGLNVEPSKSLIDLRMRQVDVSGLTYKPVDGSFIPFEGNGVAPASAHLPDGSTDVVFGTVTQTHALSLKMAFGHASRGDHQALNWERLAVVLEGFEMDTKLYNYKDGTAIAAGDLVMMRANIQAIGSNPVRTMYIPDIISAADAAIAGWVFGVVLKGAASGALVPAANGSGAKISLRIFDQPYWHAGA